MNNKQNKPGTNEDLILTLWRECRSESAGETELIHIQQTLNIPGSAESPARIARVLADHQVRLRHPEVLAADAKWREKQIKQWPDLRELNFETMENGVRAMEQLEAMRSKFLSEENEIGLQIVVEQARELKLELARKHTELANEFVQWLGIWLQNPEIFPDWSDLRQKSHEFRQRFCS
jgi:hypothetical protein